MNLLKKIKNIFKKVMLDKMKVLFNYYFLF